jgi:hypothetical protein
LNLSFTKESVLLVCMHVIAAADLKWCAGGKQNAEVVGYFFNIELVPKHTSARSSRRARGDCGGC